MNDEDSFYIYGDNICSYEEGVIYTYQLSDYPSPQQFAHYRRRKGLTQTDFANLIGKNRRTISRYETGQTPIPILVAQALRNAQQGTKKF